MRNRIESGRNFARMAGLFFFLFVLTAFFGATLFAENLPEPPALLGDRSAAPGPFLGGSIRNITTVDPVRPVRTLKITVWRPSEVSSNDFSIGSKADSGSLVPYPNVKGVLLRNDEPLGKLTTNATGVAYLQNIDEGEAELIAENEADNRFGSLHISLRYDEGHLATLDLILSENGLDPYKKDDPLAEEPLWEMEDVPYPEEYSQYPSYDSPRRMGRMHGRRGWGILGLAGLAGLAGIDAVSPSTP